MDRCSTGGELGEMTLDRAAPLYVAGHRGLVGSAIWRALARAGFTNLVGRTSSELDLRDREATFKFIDEVRPRSVVLAAAKVGGIAANDREPVEFVSDNVRIQTNVLDAALSVGVERVLFLGSSCVYPKHAPQPIPEAALLTGPLEPTNEAYAIAKIAGIVQVRSVRRQYGLPWISVMPTNLYGPGDDFSREGSHVLPALIRRYVDATRAGDEVVVNWGSGEPRREFLHVDDLAAACLLLLDRYDGDEHVNVGAGSDVTIRELAHLVSEAAGYRGRTEWDTGRPDGTPRKLLDSSRMRGLGWRPRIALEDGIRTAIADYQELERESA
jgi:GDP-L-fucose synthase